MSVVGSELRVVADRRKIVYKMLFSHFFVGGGFDGRGPMGKTTACTKPTAEESHNKHWIESCSADDPNHLLPGNMTFGALLWPYLTPYMVFVLISSIPETLLAPQLGQVMKLVLTGGVLLWFRRHYRFGPLSAKHALLALAALPVALLTWIGPFYLLSAVGIIDFDKMGIGADFSGTFFWLRLVNTVFLVAVFEELFVRVHVMGWMYQAGLQRPEKTIISSILDTMDQHPRPLSPPPLSRFSIVGATLVFAAGHHPYEYLSASLYFLFTTWIYRQTRSLWACILIHGLSNLAIALLARYWGMGWLW
jgi:membrane protease YdiL (CAAX protease family)